MSKYFFGSISSGTMRIQDLLSAFAPFCKDGGKDGKRLAKEWDALPAWDDMTPEQQDEAEFILEEMFDCLNEIAPPYGYFGAHPGDGTDYGFWLMQDFQQSFRDKGGLEVSDTADIPKDYRGEVLHVNDHGNCTLYLKTARTLKELWSIV